VFEWVGSRTDIGVGEVLVGALGISKEAWSQSAQNRMVRIITAIGFQKYRAAKAGTRQKRYQKVRPAV
jgi:hypothetical protein